MIINIRWMGQPGRANLLLSQGSSVCSAVAYIGDTVRVLLCSHWTIRPPTALHKKPWHPVARMGWDEYREPVLPDADFSRLSLASHLAECRPGSLIYSPRVLIIPWLPWSSFRIPLSVKVVNPHVDCHWKRECLICTTNFLIFPFISIEL